MNKVSKAEQFLIQNNPPPQNAILALGIFDGVHLGHQKLMRMAIAAAKDCLPHPCSTGALSFWPHPQNVFTPDDPAVQLTFPDEQAELIKALGIDYFGCFHFTKEFAALTPREFAAQVLVEQLAVAGVVIGFNFRYGRNNIGNCQTLLEAGREFGFRVLVCDPVKYQGQVISSTRIRTELSAGNVELAGALLGRPYFLKGRVARGFGRGKQLGFPTANLLVPQARLIPASGVYAGRVRIAEAEYLAAIFVGAPMTFGQFSSSVEVFIIDYNGADLYGSELQVSFIRRLRSVAKFASAEELVAQIQRDVEQIKELAAE